MSPRLELGGDGVDAGDVEFDVVAADLELEAAVALFAVAGNLGCHFFGRFLRDCSIQLNAVSEATTEEFACRHPGRLSKDVPAGHVDCGLYVGMPFQGDIHAPIDQSDLTGRGTEEVGAEFVDASPCALPEGGKIKWSQRTHLTPSCDSFVGIDANDSAVENGNALPSRPMVGAFTEWKVDLINRDAGNFHFLVEGTFQSFWIRSCM